MDETEEKVGILGKKPTDLTIGEQLKLSAAVTGIVLAIYAGGLAALVAVAKIGERRAQRKQAKLELVPNDTEE